MPLLQAETPGWHASCLQITMTKGLKGHKPVQIRKTRPTTQPHPLRSRGFGVVTLAMRLQPDVARSRRGTPSSEPTPLCCLGPQKHTFCPKPLPLSGKMPPQHLPPSVNRSDAPHPPCRPGWGTPGEAGLLSELGIGPEVCAPIGPLESPLHALSPANQSVSHPVNNGG